MELQPDELSSAYRRRSLLVHPDKFQEDPILVALANKAFLKLVEAGEILQNPEGRKVYHDDLISTLREQLSQHRGNVMKQAQVEATEGNYASAEKSFL